MTKPIGFCRTPYFAQSDDLYAEVSPLASADPTHLIGAVTRKGAGDRSATTARSPWDSFDLSDRPMRLPTQW